jgi:hypothetical protein
MESIILPTDFDISKVSFGDVRVLDNGGKVVYVSYNKAPLIVQTPEMSAPFGLQNWQNPGDSKPSNKYTMDLSFKGMDGRKTLKAFHDMLNDLDNKLIEDGFKNQQSWFKGKKLASTDVVEALYTRMVKVARDKSTGEPTDKYPPTFKMNVPYRDGKFACEVYDDKCALADLDKMTTKGSKVSAIIQCVGLWMAGGKYGCSWKVLQMKVTPSQAIRGFAFKEMHDDPVDVEEDLDDVDAKDVLDMAVDKPASNDGDHVYTTDEEDEGAEDDYEPKPTPKKVVVKGRAKK